MRNFIAHLSLAMLAACHDPQPTKDNPKEVAQPPMSDSNPSVPLILNTDPTIPILTAFGNGKLKIADGCLLFDTGRALYTPVWPRATRWDSTKREIITPAGGRYVLNKAVVLSGGPMGSVTGSDLKPDATPGTNCPPDFFGVHPN